MRLINIHTLLMVEFVADAPPYAILSHRWTDDEVTYKDFVKGQNTSSAGYRKITSFCDVLKSRWWRLHVSNCETIPDQSRLFWDLFLPVSDDSPEHQREEATREVEWIWVDTCCIDKRSSADLSEAINAMWDYYARARYCLVYLVDVDIGPNHRKACMDQVEKSAWFTRGWTLQELLAPAEVLFCNQKWQLIGAIDTGTELDISYPVDVLEEATGLSAARLKSRATVSAACFAEKVSWAASRQTTREEDAAYCLLGLLSLNMPLLYGEGGARAFRRLQKEYIQQSDDESVFAWHTPTDDERYTTTSRFGTRYEIFWGVLAPHPKCFARSRLVRTIHTGELACKPRQPYAITNKGLQFRAPALSLGDVPRLKKKNVVYFYQREQRDVYVIALNCYLISGTPDEQHEAAKQDRFIVAFEQKDGGALRRMSVETLMEEIPDGAKELWKFRRGSSKQRFPVVERTFLMSLT